MGDPYAYPPPQPWGAMPAVRKIIKLWLKYFWRLQTNFAAPNLQLFIIYKLQKSLKIIILNFRRGLDQIDPTENSLRCILFSCYSLHKY